jgi:arginine decarboxylase
LKTGWTGDSFVPIQLCDTPILFKLMMHANHSGLPLHVPGHHQGRDLPEIFAEWLGAASKIDLTELPGLDNLHHPEECILQSEELAAAYYGSSRCFYSVNGSTAGVMAAIAACTKEKQKVLFLNPFHLSAWRGILMADAIPAFIPFVWDEKEYIFQAPSVEMLRKRLQYESNFAAVYLTSPTYQGYIADVGAIVEVAHKHKIPVIVDEAHGAHLGLIPQFPMHSVAAGADIVIQSAHKTLPSLTQTAWVHVGGSLINPKAVMYHLNFLQTTSPSYLLMASLDVAQAWLRKEGPDAAIRFFEQQSEFHFHDNKSHVSDPLRHWIPIGNAAESDRLKMMLEQNGIYIEMADMAGVLSMFGFYMKKTHFERYAHVVDTWQKTRSDMYSTPNMNMPHFARIADSPLVCSPKEAQLREKVVLPLSESAGRICGTLVTPYPPGVPILLPGQRIEKDIIDLIGTWRASGYSIHGLEENNGLKTFM